MKKNIKKILITFLFIFFIMYTTVQASMLTDIVNSGGNWFKDGYTQNGDNFAKKMKSEILSKSGIVGIIEGVGYTIFFVTGAILGLKYMWSGAEGKAFMKNGLVTYFIGIVFFFIGDQVFNFFSNILISDVAKQTSYKNFQSILIGTINTVVNALAIISIMVLGIKYMFANASQRANLKTGTITMIIGASLVLCLSQIITLVINIADKQIDNNTTLDQNRTYSIVREIDSNEFNILNS